MNENDLSKIVLDTAFEIHKGLGPGLLESVYEEVLAYELVLLGLFVERQKVIPIFWKGLDLDHGFKADLIVENKLLIELKSVESLNLAHYKQVITYLKLSELKLGLLLNFNEALLKDGIKRFVNNL